MDQQHTNQRFHELVWPRRATLLRAARALTRDLAEADDLAQETLVKAYRSLHGFRDGGDIGAWLLTILRNTWIDRHRASPAARGMNLVELVEEPPARQPEAGDPSWGNPHEVLESFSDQQMIDALQRLPEEIRWTLLLVDVEGMRQQEAADVLEVPVGTIKSRVHRGHAMLRAELLPMAKDLRLVRE